MRVLPLAYTLSLDWDEAVAAVRAAWPAISDELDKLDEIADAFGSIENVALPLRLWPVALLVFLVQADPLTPSLH